MARYHEADVLYLPAESRYAALVALPKGAASGRAINDAMKGIEERNEALKNVFQITYFTMHEATINYQTIFKGGRCHT